MLRAMLRGGPCDAGQGQSAPRRGHSLFETRWPAVVSPHAERALRERAFECRPGISRFAGDRVVFERRQRRQGGRGDLRDRLPDQLSGAARGAGPRQGWQFPLYRRILSPHAEGLAFIGILEPGPGLLEIVERQGEWLGEVLAERVCPSARDRMWQVVDAGSERRSRRQFAATGPHTILCNRHAYLRSLAPRPAARALGLEESSAPRRAASGVEVRPQWLSHQFGGTRLRRSPRPRSRTFQRGSRKPVTTTIVAAGRASPKTSACAAPTASPSAGSVMNMRVRTTSPGLGARLAQRGHDDLEAAPRLHAGVRVARAVRPDRRGARHEHAVAHAHGPADADLGLVGRAGGDVPAGGHRGRILVPGAPPHEAAGTRVLYSVSP